MLTAKFEDKHWERHGDYWLLIGDYKIPAAIFIPIEDPLYKVKEMKTKHANTRATLRVVGD